MLTDLQDTTLQQRRADTRKNNAVASGISLLVGVILLLLPFLAHGVRFSLLEATLAAVAIGVAVRFTFRAYLGLISR